MRTTKAYLAGLGTTGALIATTLLLLVLGPRLVGFDGGPSLNGDEGRLYPAVGGGRAHVPGNGHGTRASRARRAALASAAGTPSAGQVRPVALGTPVPQHLRHPVTTAPQQNSNRRRTAPMRRPVVTFHELGGGAGAEAGNGAAGAEEGGRRGGVASGTGGGVAAGTPMRVAERGAGGGGVFAGWN